MDKLKKAFGYSDPLAQAQIDQAQLAQYQQAVAQYRQAAVQYQQTMMQAQNSARNLTIGAQNMAGGGAYVGVGIANASTTGYNQQWGQTLTPVGIREKVRNHIADEVEKMAEEIGAPTLLHAVVLAIRTMEIPE